MRDTLIVGIGSPHGSDRAGWLAAELLQSHIATLALAYRCSCRIAQVPHQLLDWLQGQETAHLIDACYAPHERLQRYRLDVTPAEVRLTRQALPGEALHEQSVPHTAELLSQLHSASTHHLPLPAVLQLAQQLNLLPRHVTLWTIPIAAQGFAQRESQTLAEPGVLPDTIAELPADVQQAIDQCVRCLVSECGDRAHLSPPT